MGIEGYVSGMTMRTELDGTDWVTVWDFRLERFEDSKPLPRVPVAMRGQQFDGSIIDDDLVEVDGDWKEGKTLWVREVRNLTTAAVVRAHGPREHALVRGLAVLIARLALLATLAWVGYMVWLMATAR